MRYFLNFLSQHQKLWITFVVNSHRMPHKKLCSVRKRSDSNNVYLCESEATATMFYLCESEAAATMFYLCESEAAATKKQLDGTEINHTLWKVVLDFSVYYYNLLQLF